VPRAAKFLDIEILGVQEVKYELLNGARAAGNMKPVLDDVADDMMRVIGINFSSEGRRGGGSWQFLSASRMRQKIKKGYPPDILIATGALHDSMTQRDDPDQHLQVTGTSIELSSYVPYAAAHADGTGRLPKRDFTEFLYSDQERWVGMCETYLLDAMGGLR